MGELEHITLHMALCLEMSLSPRSQLWNMARKYKRKTKNENVILAMTAVQRDKKPEINVRIITNEHFN